MANEASLKGYVAVVRIHVTGESAADAARKVVEHLPTVNELIREVASSVTDEKPTGGITEAPLGTSCADHWKARVRILEEHDEASISQRIAP